MATDTQKSHTWLRIILLVAGGIVVVISVHRLSNPVAAVDSFLENLGISLLVIGLVSIIRGISNKGASKGAREFEVGNGIVAVIGGLYPMIHPGQESLTTIRLVLLFIITFGAGLVITGFTRIHKAKANRIARITVGITIVALTGVLEIYHDLTLIQIVFFL